MYLRMIEPVTSRATLLVAALMVAFVPGCKEAVVELPPPSRLGAGDIAAMAAAQPTRTEHFAESARRIRSHPALGPHTPSEIKRRVAQLVEPIQLAAPPQRAADPESVPTRATPADGRAQVASLTPVAATKSAAPVSRVTFDADGKAISAGGRTQPAEPPADAAVGKERSTPRNVVIPMVVSSADGTWRVDGAGSNNGGARNAPCRVEALDQLKQLSTSGYRIYERISDKKMFTTWILCDDRQRGLTTAVHEAVHMLTEQLDAFPLIDGGHIKRIAALEKFAPPGRIAGQFSRSDDFVKTYLLPGGASSAEDFTYLLDEFNAYVHDLNTAIETLPLAPKDTRLGHRDGMSALMAFLMAYVAHVEKADARTWSGLHRPDVKHLVTTLWSEAERVIEKSCKVPRYSVDDREYVAHICTPANGRALAGLLGRAPRCPSACL